MKNISIKIGSKTYSVVEDFTEGPDTCADVNCCIKGENGINGLCFQQCFAETLVRLAEEDVDDRYFHLVDNVQTNE